MYILEPSIFEYMQPEKNYDWSQDIFPQILAEEKPMFGYVLGEYWTDVGSLQQYRQAQYEMLGGLTKLPIEGRREGGDIWIGEGTEIDPNARLVGPLCIGKNCRIKADAHLGPDTVIGDNCLIEEGATLQRAIVWDSNYVGANSRLTACTVCFRSTIKEDVDIQEGAVVGDRCHIEAGSTIRPLIKLWPDKIIEAGSVVTMSLIWGSKWQGALFRNLGVSGIANVEMTPDFACKLGASYGAFFKEGRDRDHVARCYPGLPNAQARPDGWAGFGRCERAGQRRNAAAGQPPLDPVVERRRRGAYSPCARPAQSGFGGVL